MISLSEFLARLETGADFPPKAVLLTFDDGQVDFYEHAFPVLNKYGLPAAVFLTAGVIGTDRMFWWDKLEAQLGSEDKVKRFQEIASRIKDLTLAEREKFLVNCEDINHAQSRFEHSALNWQEVNEMLKSGVSFGAHTVNHVNLAREDTITAEDEIRLSKRMIEEKIGQKVDAFAYPYGGEGDFTKEHIEMLKREGFRCSFTTLSGTVRRGDDPFTLRRIAISGTDNFLAFRIKLMDIPPLLKRIIVRLLR